MQWAGWKLHTLRKTGELKKTYKGTLMAIFWLLEMCNAKQRTPETELVGGAVRNNNTESAYKYNPVVHFNISFFSTLNQHNFALKTSKSDERNLLCFDTLKTKNATCTHTDQTLSKNVQREDAERQIMSFRERARVEKLALYHQKQHFLEGKQFLKVGCFYSFRSLAA